MIQCISSLTFTMCYDDKRYLKQYWKDKYYPICKDKYYPICKDKYYPIEDEL